MKRFLRWCAYLVLAFVLLVAAVYLTHGLSAQSEVNAAKRQASAELAAALPEGEVQATRDRDRARALGRLGTPAYAWQELVCELDTSESGWIVEDYVQECQVRSVDLYPASGPTSGDCQYQPLPAGGDLTDLSTPVVVSAVRGPSTAFESDRPWAASCPDWVLSPAAVASSRLLHGRRPPDLSSSPAWLVVSIDTELSSTSLGCSPWGLLFCSAPVDHPVLVPR